MTTFAVPFFMGVPMSGFAVPEPHTVVAPPLPDGSPQERMAELYRYLAGEVAAAEMPVVYAGDCVSIIGTLAGLQRRGLDPTLLFFDAHGDFNTWATTPSGFLGGMPLAMATGRGEQLIVEGAGMETIPDERAWLIGARDIDRGEDDLIAASRMVVVSVEQSMTMPVPTGPLYIHVDVDVVDPSDMPAVNYPAPGGPSLATVARAVEHFAGGEVVAFSISSWNPDLRDADVAAAATRRIADPFL